MQPGDTKNAVLLPLVRLSVSTVTRHASQNPEKKAAPEPDPVLQWTEKNFQFFSFPKNIPAISVSSVLNSHSNHLFLVICRVEHERASGNNISVVNLQSYIL